MKKPNKTLSTKYSLPISTRILANDYLMGNNLIINDSLKGNLDEIKAYYLKIDFLIGEVFDVFSIEYQHLVGNIKNDIGIYIKNLDNYSKQNYDVNLGVVLRREEQRILIEMFYKVIYDDIIFEKGLELERIKIDVPNSILSRFKLKFKQLYSSQEFRGKFKTMSENKIEKIIEMFKDKKQPIISITNYDKRKTLYTKVLVEPKKEQTLDDIQDEMDTKSKDFEKKDKRVDKASEAIEDVKPETGKSGSVGDKKKVESESERNGQAETNENKIYLKGGEKRNIKRYKTAKLLANYIKIMPENLKNLIPNFVAENFIRKYNKNKDRKYDYLPGQQSIRKNYIGYIFVFNNEEYDCRIKK
ncbi:MAG: hypothetical protein ACTSWK_14070 [Promethearchaeota archaeon]